MWNINVYGALLNPGCRFFDKRIGQSTTLSGRSITRHMSEEINEMLDGERDHRGKTIIYNDTDSVAGDSVIHTDAGDFQIERLFHLCKIKWSCGDKEYSVDDGIKVLSYDPVSDSEKMMPINYVYRHRVTKPQWEIEDENGNKITVTGDHSIMIERDGVLMEAKPADLREDDVLLTVT